MCTVSQTADNITNNLVHNKEEPIGNGRGDPSVFKLVWQNVRHVTVH
jgi:hypothetical protein